MSHTQILFDTPHEYLRTKNEEFYNLDQEYYLIYREQQFYVLTGCLDNMSQEDLDEMQLEDQYQHPEKDQGISFIICQGNQIETIVQIMNSISHPLSYRMIEEIAKFCSANRDILLVNNYEINPKTSSKIRRKIERNPSNCSNSKSSLL